MYETPAGINITSSDGIFSYIGRVTTVGIFNFWVGLILAIYIIIIIGYYKAERDFPAALGVSGFVTFIIALFFWMGNLIHGGAFAIVIALMIIGVTVLFTNNQSGF